MPLALSGSITFEQVYEEIEGDSASSAELYALLSSLSGYPIRQDLAVTGSVNQQGQVQAIGGVNEKIEGYFDVCRIIGLSGTQGVMIPQSNVQHLMLRDDVVAAVREGQIPHLPHRHHRRGHRPAHRPRRRRTPRGRQLPGRHRQRRRPPPPARDGAKSALIRASGGEETTIGRGGVRGERVMAP